MSTPPRVSVVLPAFDHGRFVTEAAESVLACTDVELELIAIDDGSTDDTLDRLLALANDARMRVLEQENRGAHQALNRGLEEARGELIFVINSDDVYHPERIVQLCQLFEREPKVAIAASWIEVVDDEGRRLGVKHAWHDLPPWPPRPGSKLSKLGDPTLALLETNYVATTSNVAIRRSLLDRGVRFRPLRYTHDWDFLLTACGYGELAIVEEPLVRYRVHGDNTIAESGRAAGEGPTSMRFEILWTLAEHCQRVLDERRGERPGVDLVRRQLSSLPPFVPMSLFRHMVSLRTVAPTVFRALLDPEDPWRRRLERELVDPP